MHRHHTGLLIIAFFAGATVGLADPVDPLIYLQPTYAPIAGILNPHKAFGPIEGADGFDDGQAFALLWQTGRVAFYSDADYTVETGLISTLGSTGLSEVSDSFPGRLAVSDMSTIYFYDMTGAFMGSMVTDSTTIADITFDEERDRILVLDSNGVHALNMADGSLTELTPSGGLDAIEVIDMQRDPNTYDMLQEGRSFRRFNLDGTIHPGNPLFTNLGEPNLIHGIAYTATYAVMAVQGGYLVYDALGFQAHMETQAYGGACCRPDGTCQDGVDSPACACVGGSWTVGTTCADLSPACPSPNPPVDPYIYLQPTYAHIAAIPNPHEAFGPIRGADAFNDGQAFALLWQDGSVAFYSDSDYTVETSLIATAGSTGISEVSGSFPGRVAVSSENSIDFYDVDGTFIVGLLVRSSTIRDIALDAERDRILVLDSNGVHALNMADGSLTELTSSGGLQGIELVDMDGTPDTYDMLQEGRTFRRVHADGSMHPDNPFVTDLGALLNVHGIAYTYAYAVIAAEDGYFVYDRLAFQEHMETQPYLGACCQPDSVCVDCSTRGECAVAGGVYQGWRSLCAELVCDGSGACCATDGSCSVISQATCTGTWLGAGTFCDVDSCAVPCPGDVDQNGVTNLSDLGAFTTAMNGVGQAAGDPAADLDEDGDCDLQDFALWTLSFPCP